MERLLQGNVAVITGTSRGIGAEIAKSLAGEGVAIIGNYVDPVKKKRADSVEQVVESLGSKMKSVLADITEPGDRQALLSATLTDYPKGIDYLILNAAGGLEKGKPKGWGEKINITAQLALVDIFLPHIRPGGYIIYLTSLWAHKYGKIEQIPFYQPIAQTKYIAEVKLREKIPELNEKGIKLGILCGSIVQGTATHLIFARALRTEMAALEKASKEGKFPEAKDMGNAVRDMILSGFESGHTYFVGQQQ